MNLRNAENYVIGLDIGTGSVGWAVVDEDGKLCKMKGKNTWGSRLFDSAKTAASTRVARTLRRRYGRRYRRIQDLRSFLYEDLEKVDPDFFNRLNQSELWADDRDFNEPYILFNDVDYSEKEYYKEFSTIYHLRTHLVNSNEKEDIRLIYLALHHMMKYRGNFLIEGKISAANASATASLNTFLAEFAMYAEACGLDYSKESADLREMQEAIENPSRSRRERQEAFSNALKLSTSAAKIAKILGEAAFGYQVNFGLLFELEESSDLKFSLEKEDKVEKFEEEFLPEEYISLFESLKALYSAYLLADLLKNADGGTLSSSMVALYDEHKADLKRLKKMVRTYLPKISSDKNNAYNELFRGSKYKDGKYKRNSAKERKGYTGYILGKVSAEDFYKTLRETFDKISFSENDQKYWDDALSKMDDGVYLRKQRTSANGAIPHQLHLEEMSAIIQRQKKFYPSLQKNGNNIQELLKFRLPYYVGPLGKEKNPQRAKSFAWAIRHEGMEDEPVKPWNFDDVVDRDGSAEAFIKNLTGECSYYLGKSVIPKNSLLYSEFCVLQELNVCRQNADGEKFLRMDQETVQNIVADVFKKRKKVKVSDIENYLKSRFASHYKIKGTQKENEFASSLTSYCDFVSILGRQIETYQDYEMVENLITWVTVFEDKKILKRRIENTYGRFGTSVLSAEQVKRICKLRYTGWSRLSREFLEELRVEYCGRRVCIMDVLRDSFDRTPKNLMEVLADKRFGFNDRLDEINRDFLQDQKGYLLEDIPGSPAIKRGINQSLKIVDEIVGIAGKPPVRICIEMAREEVGKTKGSRTKSRLKNLDELYSNITKEMELYADQKDLKNELRTYKDKLDNKRLYLYFLQRGKCAYSGESLKIEQLSLYHIDHIVPQSMVKDDSFDNQVLVKQLENERKIDVYPLPDELRRKNYRRWASLHDAKLMSDKKFRNLTETHVSNQQARGFINRQLVETRQISKHVVTLLQATYPDVVVEAVKAELSSTLRNQYGLYKSRAVNDWHHAHDAFLACQISRFLSIRFPKIAEDLDYATFSRFAAATKKKNKGHSGLIVNSFGINGFDPETGEIFRDEWYAEKEIERIRACLNYRDCFVSRKVEKLTGEFWNQTIYSPREKTEKAIPLKANKPTSKYGYYQSPNLAYCSVIEHTVEVRGKVKKKISVVGVPINASYGISGKEDLLKYFEGRYESPRILKPFIMKYQKIRWGGVEYYLTSASEMINARQLWLPAVYIKLLADTHKSDERISVKPEHEVQVDELFAYLCYEVATKYPRYKNTAEKLASDKVQDRYRSKTLEQKVKAIDELLAMLHCNAARGLKECGGSSGEGRMNSIPEAAIQDLVFIDSSVTGLFESSHTIEL